MTKKQSRYNIFLDTTRIVKASELDILSETKLPNGDKKLVCKTCLQESMKKNKNKRIYKQNICESIVQQLAPAAKQRNLLMEIDHPLFAVSSGNPEQMKQRAGIVELNNCGAVCREISCKGNQIIGEVESLSSFKGPDFAKAILDDGLNIGFSLRAFGSVDRMNDGTLIVKENIMPITYDIVSNPSHDGARVLELIPETDLSLFGSTYSDNQIMCEGYEFEMIKEDDINLNNGMVLRINKFMDEIIQEQFLDIISNRVISFRF